MTPEKLELANKLAALIENLQHLVDTYQNAYNALTNKDGEVKLAVAYDSETWDFNDVFIPVKDLLPPLQRRLKAYQKDLIAAQRQFKSLK